jgi:hypothetical protein
VNPETQTVSHFFPKLWAALQRKFGTDAAYRAGRGFFFGLFWSGDATLLAGIGEVAGLFDVTHRT